MKTLKAIVDSLREKAEEWRCTNCGRKTRKTICPDCQSRIRKAVTAEDEV